MTPSATILLLVALPVALVCGEVAEANEESCLLQGKVAVASSSLAHACPLPANARWCQVTLGSTFSMAVYGSDDIVSNSICSTGTWELSASDVAELGKPAHALDIGANVGFYSLVLAAAGWNVTAFEPMASNSALIEATMCANPILKPRVTLNKFGLGSKDDHCIIVSGDDNVGDGVSKCGEDAQKFKQQGQAGYHERASMDIRRLDDILAQQQVKQLDFVKMDVEGFECQVMAGGQSLLTKYRPKIIQSEVWPTMQGCLPQAYLASFAKANYTVAKDRACSTQDLSRPSQIDNRFMCRKTSVSLLETVASLEKHERSIVWLRPEA
jgi:FkbM family methyltransferase